MECKYKLKLEINHENYNQIALIVLLTIPLLNCKTLLNNNTKIQLSRLYNFS